VRQSRLDPHEVRLETVCVPGRCGAPRTKLPAQIWLQDLTPNGGDARIEQPAKICRPTGTAHPFADKGVTPQIEVSLVLQMDVAVDEAGQRS
jgi:hypothetical protein